MEDELLCESCLKDIENEWNGESSLLCFECQLNRTDFLIDYIKDLECEGNLQ